MPTLNAFWNDPSWFYTIVQIGVLTVFLIAAFRAAQHNGARVLELFTACAFGLLLEEGDILIFKTYRYDPHWLSFDLVPPAIALTWALIITSAMNLSDAMGIDDRIAPLADALWAILLDLSLDAVAIRLGMWRWTIPLDAGWFGVPYGNFYAWLWVAASFSFFTRWVRRRGAALWQGIVPFVAYAGLLASLAPYAVLQRLFFRQAGSDGVLFGIALGVFCLVAFRGVIRSRVPREAPDSFLAATRYLIHLCFLWALLATGIAVQLPPLLFVSLAMLALETLLVVLVHRAPPRNAVALPQD